MSTFRTRYIALVLGAAAVVAAGCGSSSSSKSAAKPPAASTPATPSTPSTPTTSTTSAKQVIAAFEACLKKAGLAFKPISGGSAGETGAIDVTDGPNVRFFTSASAAKSFVGSDTASYKIVGSTVIQTGLHNQGKVEACVH